MFHRVKPLFAVLLMFALLNSGCSKKDSSPTEPQTTDTPTIPTVTFKGPNTSSTDINAQMIKSYASAMNTFSTMFLPYQQLQSARSGNTWTWTYTDRTLTATFTATSQSDGSYQWKMVLNGVDADDGTTYNKWTALEGTTSGDGKTGSWKIYDENKTTVATEFNWTTTNNVLTGIQKDYSSGAVTDQITLINNPDNSGEMRVYSGTVMTYKATWTSTGSGQWWTYNSSGAQSGTGSWT